MVDTLAKRLERETSNLKAKMRSAAYPGMNDVSIYEQVDNTECDPDCPVCQGVGFVRGDYPVHHEKFGKMQPCPERMTRLMSERGGGGLDASEFTGLTWDKIKPGISDGHKVVQPIRTALGQGHGLVFLYGTYGQAKTLALKIAVAQALRNGMSAHYANMGAILDDVRAAFDAEQSGAELRRRMEKWGSYDVLSIDELDKVNDTPWAKEKIHHLLDQRYAMAVRESAVTLIAANVSGVDGLDGYLKSRLKDNRFDMIELNGADGRRVMQKGWTF